jgi:hypothetical protein
MELVGLEDMKDHVMRNGESPVNQELEGGNGSGKN